MKTLLALFTLGVAALAGCAHESPPAGNAASTSGRPVETARLAHAYLEITLKVDASNRTAAAGVYAKYKQPFLDTVPGAISKELLVRNEDVVVLHGFDTAQHAADYLKSSLFTNDVVVALKPLLAASPDVRVYSIP